jgi:hypothetical protein
MFLKGTTLLIPALRAAFFFMLGYKYGFSLDYNTVQLIVVTFMKDKYTTIS